MARVGRAVAAIALVLAACGGNDDDIAAPRATTTTQAPSTTAAPSTTTTTAGSPPPYSFDGSVPPPPLVNTGTDYEAIFESLDAYGEWLYAHNPDPELVDEWLVVSAEPDSAYALAVDDLTKLRDRRQRLYLTSADVIHSEVASELENLVSLRVDATQGDSVLVAEDGTELSRIDEPDGRFIVLLSADANGRWRIVSVSRVDS